MDLPSRTLQLIGARDPDKEGMYDYARRCWEAEFKFAMEQIRDVQIRNALFALYHLGRDGYAPK